MLVTMTRLNTFLVGACLAMGVAACSSGSKSSEPAKEAKPSTDPGLTVVNDEGGPPPFDVEVQDWEGPAGEEGQILVTVKAKTGFKINDKYPHKVKLDAPPDGLSVPMLTIAKKDAQLSGDKSITYTIPATAAKAGQYQLSGVVKLSVCSKDQCRMAKEQVSANVTAQ
jgi:hypothetical protein